jgi:hypothetical protein
MLNNNDSLVSAIKNIILTNFPYAGTEVIFDKEQNEYFISTRNKELYYSEAYGMLILEINKNTLWEQGIFNIYFILDVRDKEFDKMTEQITFSFMDETAYKTWDVNKTSLSVDKHIDTHNFSLAA